MIVKPKSRKERQSQPESRAQKTGISKPVEQPKKKIRSLLKPSSTNYLPLFTLASLGLGGVNLLAILFLSIGVFALAGKPPPRLLERVDGSVMTVSYLDSDSPSPKAIKAFVAETVFGLYDWRAILPPEKPEEVGAPKPDSGVTIPVGQKKLKITPSTWKYGFRLSDSFRREFMMELAKLTPQSIFRQEGGQATIIPENISPPQNLGNGEWKVTYQGKLVIFDNGNNLGSEYVREHEIILKEVGRYQFSTQLKTEKTLTDKEFEQISDIQKMLYEARNSGLIIKSMRELPK